MPDPAPVPPAPTSEIRDIQLPNNATSNDRDPVSESATVSTSASTTANPTTTTAATPPDPLDAAAVPDDTPAKSKKRNASARAKQPPKRIPLRPSRAKDARYAHDVAPLLVYSLHSGVWPSAHGVLRIPEVLRKSLSSTLRTCQARSVRYVGPQPLMDLLTPRLRSLGGRLRLRSVLALVPFEDLLTEFPAPGKEGEGLQLINCSPPPPLFVRYQFRHSGSDSPRHSHQNLKRLI